MQQSGKTRDQVIALAEILLGVAYADGTYDAQERREIEGLVGAFAGLDTHVDDFQLPEGVLARMQVFDQYSFDVFDAVVRLELQGRQDAREILHLVMRMVDADSARDTSEESYFMTLAKALGLTDEAFEIMLGLDD